MDYTGFIIGGLSSAGATVITNPLEVVKTRMQLQGELAAKGTSVEPYRNVFQAFYKIAKNDGYFGLQKGLSAALCFQFILNACRLGIYNSAVINGYTKTKSGKESIFKGAIFGGISGYIGTAVANPFFLIKTQLQSQAVSSIAVGYQHHHISMIGAFKSIFKANGIGGLYRGVIATIPRSMLGSGGQLATFGFSKDYIIRNNLIADPSLVALTAGFLAGTVMSITITPPDTIVTRLYNQGLDKNGKGIYYKGVVDCCFKIVKKEGLFALYKGFWAQYFRMGPHATLVLLFFDEINRFRWKITEKI